MPSLHGLTPLARALLIRHSVRKPRLLAAAGLAMMLPAVTVQAQDIAFDIPAQPLASALREFGRQANVEVLYSPGVVEGQKSTQVKGSLSAEQAIAQLLRGAKVRYSLQGNVLTLSPPAEYSAMELGATTVTSSGLGGTTEGTGSYTTGTASMLKGNTRLKDIPQSVSVITRQQMQDQNVKTVDEAMMETPGISKSVTNAGNHVFLSRGFEIRNYQYDGIPMGYWAKGGFGKQSDMAMYDHVEVLRGAAGMLIGAGDPSGTVNLVRKRPTDDFRLNMAAQAGSWDDYHTELDVSGPLSDDKRLRGRTVLSYQSKDYFYDGTHSEMPFFYGVLDFALTDDTRIAAGMRYQRAWQPRIWAGNLPGSNNGTNLHLSRSTTLAPDWARQLDETYEYFVDMNHDFNENWHGKVGVNHLQIKNDTETVWVLGSVDPSTMTGARLTPYYSWNNIRATGVDANLTGNFESFGLEHRLVIGANYLKSSENSAQGYGTAFPINLNDLNVNVPKPTSINMSPANNETINKGVYGNINLQLAEPLHLILGGRVSEYSYDNIFGTTKTTAQEHGQVTPYAALLYDLTPDWTLYTSYTDIFNPQYNYKSATGGALKPTTGYNYEAGIKGEMFEGRLNTSLAVFYTRQKDRGQRLDSNLCTGALTICYTEGGEVESKGIEMQVSGEILDRWQANVGYTYNRQVYVKDVSNAGGNFSDSTPRHLFRAYTSYQFAGPLERLTIGGGMTAQSDTYYLSGAYSYAQSGYAVWNTFARYQLDDHWNVQLNANNIFDRYYYEDQGGRLYGTPRNYTVTLRGSF
ncbi:TonB-dependent siderophore receptor [Pseudomonas putida]|uniref:TonB-dependent siderophore receptor n=1 Tax=Pseudomonas putida TaxID=303 RepID=UPI0005B98B08|nr:TonB-dependent receptor [Pseudomonas putida]